VLVFRVLVRLQGLAQSLEVKTSVGDALQPYLSELLQHRFDPRRIAQDALRTLRGWDRLLQDLPDDVRSVVHQLSRGEVAVDLRLHDPDRVMDQLVDGLVASSSLLAAALLWSRRADPVLRGISIPGAVTAVVGVGTWIRLVRARRERRRDGLTRTIELARTVRRVVPRRTRPAP
jgi:ubiquinone biosynthesis protein